MLEYYPIDVYPIECPVAEAAGVPRRFGVGVLLILVTFFSVLFAFLRCVDSRPEVAAIVGVLFVGVAAGQSLLFGGKNPRGASLLIGAVLFPLEVLGLAVYQMIVGQVGRGSIAESIVEGESIVVGLICTVPGGAVLGYLAGVLTAGIFLTMDHFGKARTRAGQPLIELQPFTEADIDTLLEWVDSPALFELWGGSAFSPPLDRPQLQRRLQQAAGEDPELLAFKAVCTDSGRTVGHVELGNIDRAMRSATVGLAIVGPDESGRGELSMMLLRAVLERAFGRMKLRRVEAIPLVSDSQAISLYRRLGFISEGVFRDSARLRAEYGDQRIMSMLRHEWLWALGWRRGKT